MSAAVKELRKRIRAAFGENKALAKAVDGAPTACCENGVFVGRREDDVAVYRGVPYAKPPIGVLRWRRPEPPERQAGVFEAFYNGRSPIQTEWETETASFYPQGEDCLYLNIWVSEADQRTDKTVMVFFHGGSYGWGGTADPLYDGHRFISGHSDIVLVTVGYRTGLMGFVDFSSVPGGEDYADAPNLGLLDQIEALRWVRRNIAAFGGDPDNVTIFGESAGGGSVSLLPLIPEAKGLFRRVIAESGSVALTFSQKECAEFTRRLLKESRCETMEELLALSEEQLRKVNEKLNAYNNFPQRDGRIVPLDPYAPYLAGETAGVDMMLGTNKNELNYWIGEIGGIVPYAFSAPIKYENDLLSLKAADRKLVHGFVHSARRRYKHKIWCRAEFYNELMFRLPAVKQAEGHSQNGGRVYMYYWTEPSTLRYRGACHAVELAYVFGNLHETIYTGEPGDPELSRKVQDMWANFARTGNPEVQGLTWPLYDAGQRQTMVIARQCGIERDLLKEQRETLTPLLDYWINPSYATLNYNVPFVRKLIAAIVAVLLVVVALCFILYRVMSI